MLPQPQGRSLNILLIAAFIAFAVSQSMLASIFRPLGADTCFSFWLAMDRDVALSVMQQWGPDGIAHFRTHYRLDFLHPILFGLLLYFGMVRFCKPLPGYSMMLWVPIFAGVADIIENILQIMVLNAGENVSAQTVMFSGAFARAKWTFAGVGFLWVVVGLIATGIRSLRAPK